LFFLFPSGNKKSEEYRGKKAFSENESRIVRDLVHEIPFDAVFSIHSGTRQIIIPFSETRKEPRYHWNQENELKLASKVAMRMNNTFQYGRVQKLLKYSADGTLMDYVAGKTKVMIVSLIDDSPHELNILSH